MARATVGLASRDTGTSMAPLGCPRAPARRGTQVLGTNGEAGCVGVACLGREGGVGRVWGVGARGAGEDEQQDYKSGFENAPVHPDGSLSVLLLQGLVLLLHENLLQCPLLLLLHPRD